MQEAWIKASRADAYGAANLSGWFTTIVARVALDMRRSRRSRREESWEVAGTRPATHHGADPEAQAVLADSI